MHFAIFICFHLMLALYFDVWSLMREYTLKLQKKKNK